MERSVETRFVALMHETFGRCYHGKLTLPALWGVKPIECTKLVLLVLHKDIQLQKIGYVFGVFWSFCADLTAGRSTSGALSVHNQ